MEKVQNWASTEFINTFCVNFNQNKITGSNPNDAKHTYDRLDPSPSIKFHPNQSSF